MNVYTDYEVPKRRHKKYGLISMIFRPFWFFMKSYLLGGGFKDGKRGVATAYMAAVYQMMLISKLLEDKYSKG